MSVRPRDRRYAATTSGIASVDAIFPANPTNKKLLIRFIKQVGEEMGLATDEKSLWFNDSVGFFGLETKSNVVIFHHPFLVLKAASWEELLAHKVHASRHDIDIQDAVLLLKEIKDKYKEQVYEEVKNTHLLFLMYLNHCYGNVLRESGS